MRAGGINLVIYFSDSKLKVEGLIDMFGSK